MIGTGFYDQNSRQILRWRAVHTGSALNITAVMNDGSTPRLDYGDGFASASTTWDGRFFANGIESASTVTLYTHRLNHLRQFQYVPTLGEGIQDRLDLTACTQLAGTVIIGNHAMSALTFPAATEATTDLLEILQVSNNDNVPRYDFSGLTNVGRTSPSVGVFQFIGNDSLTGVTVPNTTHTLGINFRTNVNLLDVDLTPLIGLKNVTCHQCSNLTALTFPNSASTEQLTGDISIYNCFDLLDLDFARFGDKFGYGNTGFIADNMTSLTAITFPRVNNSMTGGFQLKNTNFASDYELILSSMTGNSGTFFDIGEMAVKEVRLPITDGQWTTFLRFISFSNLKHLDLTPFSGINCQVVITQNSALTGITFGEYNNPSYVYNGLYLNTNDLTGILDLTRVTGLTTAFQANTNPNLTAVTFPHLTSSITDFQITNCNLNVLDFTNLAGIGGNISFRSNNNMTAVTFSSTTGTITNLDGDTCDLRDIDFSLLGNAFGGTIDFNNNPNLTAITLPSTTQTVTSLDFNACDLGKVELGQISGANQSGIFINLDNNSHTAAECNQMLGILNATGWINGTLWLSGTGGSSTTAVGFDTTSGGEDGWAHFQALTANGWTILMTGLTM